MLPVVIEYDPGGIVGERFTEIEAMRASGQPVVINGPCLSACTMYLGLPPDQICATKRASFGFHFARVKGAVDYWSSKIVWDSYPAAVQAWLTARGGLSEDLKRMQPADVARFVRPCEGSGAAAAR